MYYKANGINIFVKDTGGSEPALLFLHFWGGASSTWDGVVSFLKDEHRCISYDHRGWGRTDKPESGYSIRELAQDAYALIRELKLENFILVGHSMGGKIAQFIASQNPPGLQKLILVAPSPSFPTIPPVEMKQNMINAYTSLEGINATIDEVFKAGDLPKDLRAQTIENMENHNDSSRLGWPLIALVEDVSQNISDINVPTLIIAGGNDIVDPPDRLKEEVNEKIKDSKMVIIPNVGHLSMLQEPEKIAAYITDFI